MSNVLPPEELHDTRRVNDARLLLVVSLSVILGALIALLALVPSYALLRADSSEGDVSAESLSAMQKEERDEIIRAQSMVRALAPIASSTPAIAETVRFALEQRPAGVLVRNIGYTREPQATLVLSGTASSRDHIYSYRTALLKNPVFQDATVPIQNLTGGRGVFTITLTGTF